MKSQANSIRQTAEKVVRTVEVFSRTINNLKEGEAKLREKLPVTSVSLTTGIDVSRSRSFGV